MTLDLALVTWQPEGIARVAAQQLPRVDGVRYVVSWQNHGDAPVPESLLQRDDVEIHRCELTGVANNRNNAVDHCRADIILMADDDIAYDADALREIIAIFESHPELDLATLRYDSSRSKPYPPGEMRLTMPLPVDYWVSTVEVAVRRDSEAGRLRFCPDFGPGALYPAAEDEIFFLAAVRRGVNCRYVPVSIGRHPNLPSGATVIRSKAYYKAIGVFLSLCYGSSAPLRAVIRSWRLRRQGRAPFFRSLVHIIKGITEAPAVMRRNRQYLWP